jgi:hypothetical protein
LSEETTGTSSRAKKATVNRERMSISKVAWRDQDVRDIGQGDRVAGAESSKPR